MKFTAVIILLIISIVNVPAQAETESYLGDNDIRTLVSPEVFSRITTLNNCPMITEQDRIRLNKNYVEFLEKNEKEKLPAACDLAIDQVEDARHRMNALTKRIICLESRAQSPAPSTGAVECGEGPELAMSQEKYNQAFTEIFGDANQTSESRVEFAVRVCPSGATKLKKLLMGLEAGLYVGQFAFPQLWMARFALDMTKQGIDIKKNGMSWGRAENLGWSIGSRIDSRIGWIKKVRKNLNIKKTLGSLAFWKRGDDKNQFVDKLEVCRANTVAFAETEEACTQQMDQSDLVRMRDNFLRLSENKADKNSAGFCSQTACLWSFDSSGTDKNWRKHVENKLKNLPAPAQTPLDNKGKPLDPLKELQEGLEVVDSWRGKCAKEGAALCQVSCRTAPGRAPPQENPPSSGTTTSASVSK